jgi:hypothetical protein
MRAVSLFQDLGNKRSSTALLLGFNSEKMKPFTLLLGLLFAAQRWRCGVALRHPMPDDSSDHSRRGEALTAGLSE